MSKQSSRPSSLSKVRRHRPGLKMASEITPNLYLPCRFVQRRMNPRDKVRTKFEFHLFMQFYQPGHIVFRQISMQSFKDYFQSLFHRPGHMLIMPNFSKSRISRIINGINKLTTDRLIFVQEFVNMLPPLCGLGRSSCSPSFGFVGVIQKYRVPEIECDSFDHYESAFDRGIHKTTVILRKKWAWVRRHKNKILLAAKKEELRHYAAIIPGLLQNAALFNPQTSVNQVRSICLIFPGHRLSAPCAGWMDSRDRQVHTPPAMAADSQEFSGF